MPRPRWQEQLQPGSPAAVYVVTENYQHSWFVPRSFSPESALLGANGDPGSDWKQRGGPR